MSHKHMMRRVDVVYGTPGTWYFECECGAWALWDQPPHTLKRLFDGPDDLFCLSTVEREKSFGVAKGEAA